MHRRYVLFEKDKVAICIPSKNGFKKYFDRHFYNWINQLNEEGRKYKIFYLRDATNHVATQRNSISDMVLKDGTCEWMLWLDDDVLFPLDVIDQFLETKKNFVTGIYWNRSNDEIHYPLLRKTDTGTKEVKYKYYECEDDPLFEINACGMGCFWMKTEMMHYIVRPRFMLSQPTGIGEDINFCRYLASAGRTHDGFQLYALATVLCKHLNYDPDVGDMYAIPSNELYGECYAKYCQDRQDTIDF